MEINNIEIKYRDMKNRNTNELLASLNCISWDTCFTHDNINNILNAFRDKVNTVLDEHIPFKAKRVKRQHQPPWITTAVKERDKLLKIARKSNLQADWNQFEHPKCKTSNLIKKAKRNYFPGISRKEQRKSKRHLEGSKDSQRNAKTVPANFRSLVYFYGIKNSGVEEWDFAFEQFQNTTVASERRKILYGLAGASEPWILSRYLQYSITPDKIKSQDTSRVLSYVANYNPNGRQLTWQFLKLNWNLIKEKFGGGFFAIRNIILSVTSGFSTEFELEDLKEFNRKHSAGSGTRAQQQAEEGVMANIQWRKENEQDVSNWLKYFLEKNNIPLN
ncbi:Aminopeptidase N [Stylophora pistillata]|uniref:Aminopeptidase N n=1 Tax=Stylophora pistillata TaxID=50429 RepID=A0A2B4S1E3_STYPI|nr:Aminopeptidase N [Stylophora pistillata]